MREILFRGKDKFDGEWYVGSLSHDTKYGNCFIEVSVHQGIAEEVIPETVGQYTGLKDKTGKKIFEGDIVKITGFHTTAIAAVKYGSRSEKSTSWGWYFDDNDGHTYLLESQAFCEDYNAIIIGNIYDNPELLEVAEND